jgi:hypothetical protein
MNKKLIAFLSIISIIYCIPVIPVSAASENCPENWNLQIEGDVGNSFGLETWHLKDKSGNLEKYKSQLGFNVSTSSRIEFSLDNSYWIEKSWPIVLPDKSKFTVGPNSFFYLYPGFDRGVIKIEVKGCEKSKEFFTPAYKTHTQIVKENFTIDQVIGNYRDFKQKEILIKSINDDLSSSISAFSKIGKIKQAYPSDDSFIYISPAVPGCVNFDGPHPGYWVSNGKSCEMLVYGQAITIDGKRYYSADDNGNLLTSNSNKSTQVMFVVSKFTISKPNFSKSISCAKGKTIKKVSGINPKCPAGYKKK